MVLTYANPPTPFIKGARRGISFIKGARRGISFIKGELFLVPLYQGGIRNEAYSFKEISV